MPIHSLVHYIMAGESAGTNGLKCFILCLKSTMAAGKIKASNLYKTFLDLLF